MPLCLLFTPLRHAADIYALMILCHDIDARTLLYFAFAGQLTSVRDYAMPHYAIDMPPAPFYALIIIFAASPLLLLLR